MVTNMLYASRRTADGGRDMKRKVERLGEEVFIKDFKLKYPSLEEYIEKGLGILCDRYNDQNHPGNVVPKQETAVTVPSLGSPGNLVPKLVTGREAGDRAKRTKLN